MEPSHVSWPYRTVAVQDFKLHLLLCSAILKTFASGFHQYASDLVSDFVSGVADFFYTSFGRIQLMKRGRKWNKKTSVALHHSKPAIKEIPYDKEPPGDDNTGEDR